MYEDLAGKFGTKHSGKYESQTNSNISQTSNSSAEVVHVCKEVWAKVVNRKLL
jgi:hypothetical protein